MTEAIGLIDKCRNLVSKAIEWKINPEVPYLFNFLQKVR